MKKLISWVMASVALILASPNGQAASISVSTANDVVNGNTTSISALQSSHGGDGISLREAVMAANNTAGAPHTINLPAGTYNLSISGGITTAFTGESYPANPAIGDLDIMRSGISLVGAGAASTIIRQTTPTLGTPSNDRVIEINPNIELGFTFNMSGVTITGGRSPDYGGGMVCGSTNNVVTVTSCVFSNNTAINAASPGGGICNYGGGTLVLIDSTFVNNSTTASSGGGVYVDNNPAPGSINVTNCVFTNNASASGSDGGGGLYVLGSGTSTVTKSTFINNRVTSGTGSGGGIFFGSSGTLNVSLCSFAGNQGASRGGGIHVNGGTVNVSFCRFSANTGTTGSGLSRSGGTLTAEDNWWGINTGPAAGVVSGSTPTRWLQLRHAATTPTIAVGGSTALTADLFGRNSGGAIASTTLVGLPSFSASPAIFNGATLGTLSGVPANIVNGLAGATYTATSKGTASITANSDSQSVAILVVNESAAVVTNVTSSVANGSYTVGQNIPVTVMFDEIVNVVGSPTLTLETGNPDAVATYSSGTGTRNLVFNYVVANGNTSADLDYVSSSALSLNGGTIRNGTLNLNAVLTLPQPGNAGSLRANKNILIDTTALGISISDPSVVITNGGSVTFTVTYSDANFSSSSLAPGHITLNKTGTANGTVGVSGSGNTRTVTVSSLVGNGTLGISIAAGTGSDTAGNTAPAAGPSNTFAVDTTSPGITISAPSRSITSTNATTYTVTYSDPNFSGSTLTSAQVTLNKTSMANGTVTVSGTGSTRTVTISGISGDGAIGISIAANTASDTAGNFAPAAGPSATFNVDNTAPSITCPNTVTVNAAANSCSVTNVALGTPVTADAGGVASVTNNTPAILPVGTNTVIWTVTDQVGFTNSCSQLVVVRDVTIPSITCPTNMLVLRAAGQTTGAVSFNVSGTDDCSPFTLVSVPPSGSSFSNSVTTVTNVARDSFGNSNVCTFTITINHHPVAVLNTLGTRQGQPAAVSVAQLLANDTDEDSDSLSLQSISSTSTNGGSVALASGTVTYTPLSGLVGEDRFTYNISDGRGGSSVGTVVVTVISQDSPALNYISIKPTVGGKLLRFVGTAGQSYKFQAKTPITGVWGDITAALVANPAGLIQFEHTTNTAPQQFYRTVSTP